MKVIIVNKPSAETEKKVFTYLNEDPFTKTN
jgi:hypothetical protein